jgi:membrane protein involved in colicin uptake
MDAIDQLLANLSPNTKINSTPTGGSTDPLIAQIKAEQIQLEQEKQQEIDRHRNQQEQLKQQRLEQLKQQRRAALHNRAETWFANLTPNSAEARWFEEFACNYNNKTEAAIAYLEALEDLNNLHP